MEKSNEEKWFESWLDEAKVFGYVKSWKRAERYILVSSGYFDWKEELKTKVKNQESHFCQEQSYTPDYEIVFSKSFPEAMFQGETYPKGTSKKIFKCNSQGVCLVDTKGIWFGHNNSDIRFPLKQALMLEKYGLFVNKITIGIPTKNKSHLFDITWYPKSIHIQYQIGQNKGLLKKDGCIRLEQYAERNPNPFLGEDSSKTDVKPSRKSNRRTFIKGKGKDLS